MTITQLEYIVALDTHRHFAKASKKCFVTQPTLSMQINKLEKELGVVIFDRSKQPVTPTEMGKKIIEQARLILKESSKIQDIIDHQKDNLEGELRIGIIPTLAPYLLPRFVTQFIKKYRQIKLIAEELQTEQIIARLKNETLDAGILVTPLNEPGILEEHLFYEAFVGYISRDNKLYDKEYITSKDINLDELWLLNQGHCFRNQMLNICGDKRRKNAAYKFEYESGSLETLKRLVEQESGMTLLPELAVTDIPKSEIDRVKIFNDPKPLREVSLVVHRSFLKKRVLDVLKEDILNSIPEHMKNPEGKIVTWR